MSKDYYKILGVEKGASAEEIKTAFRKLAHEHHPDKAGGNEAKFKELNEAYQVLGNKDKRAQYDQFGTAFEGGGFGAGGGAGPFGFGGGFGGNANMNDFSDIFEGLGDIFGGGFGGTRTRQKRRRGSDIQIDMEIDIRDSVFGAERDVTLQKNVVCEQCHGNGAEPGTPIETCSVCRGSGSITRMQQTFLGAMRTQTACSSCKGEGKTAKQKCSACAGRGITHGKETIRVRIPAGIEDGGVVKFAGRGEAAPAGAGDLYITFHLKPDTRFERDGTNILSVEKISFKQAALGDKIDAATLQGTVNLKIPAGAPSGTVFRLKGKGAPSLRGYGVGDQLVRVIVEIPKTLTRKQKKILEEWDG